MHRALQRQLKRATGVADEAELAALIEAAQVAANGGNLPPALGRLLGGLSDLLQRIGGTYEQYERDLALRTRSLELSSQELTVANEKLREDLASRNRALSALRETAGSLLGDDAVENAAALAGNDLESLTVLMSRLIEAREAERRELDNQKFALDQHAIVSITDTQGVILYANQRFCDVSGYSQEELIGQPHRIVKSGVHPPEVFAEMWQTISSGKVWHGEVCNRRKNGELYWVSATIVPFLDAAGLPTRYIGIRTDITERKAMEAALQEQLRLVEELIEAIPLPLYMKDRQGRYQRLNRAFELFFAVRREDFLGRTLYELLRPEDARLHAEKDEELYRTGGSQAYEARVASHDGAVHDTIYRKAVLTRSDGSISGLLGTIIDITERKEAEIALTRAKQAAEAANRAKSDFLANMSHEIRTPMNGVIGMTELALGTELNGEAREYLQIVKTSAESLLTIINDILDFSKIEAGKMQIERISFHLPRLFSDAMKTLALRAHEKGLELVLDFDQSLPKFVFGDPGRLRQILLNLAGNAIKFTERGEIVIRVRPGEQRDRIRCEVQDTGVGIAEDKIGQIFEAFIQEDTSTTRRFGGTGLGLTICRRLVTMMDGRLWVESQLGAGSIFRFEIALPADAAREEGGEPAVTLAGLRMTVVDDNATNRLVLSRMLSGWGVQVSTCASGAELLQRLDELRPQLIVLDAHMPEMDGFMLAERLRVDPRAAKVPCVMLSSGATRGDAQQCRDSGIAAYFSKPVLPEDLLSGLLTVLGAGSGQPAAGLVTRHSLREARQEGGGDAMAVLLVEDHPINQKLAINLLEKWGHRVTLANNGQEALDRVAAGRFDAILMDVQMPVMGGLEATQRLRLAGCRTPIIAMTANAMQGDRELCLEAGMDDYIAKPIKADELRLLLDRMTGTQPHTDKAAGRGEPAFDYDAALSAVDAEILDVVAPLFVESTPDDLAALRQALATGDVGSALRHAHTLRGLLGTFYAEPAVRLARQIEDALQRGDVDRAILLMPDFEAAVEGLLAVMRERGQVL